jgi:uncharacterized hydantoinase/oxoprolinase family protein
MTRSKTGNTGYIVGQRESFLPQAQCLTEEQAGKSRIHCALRIARTELASTKPLSRRSPTEVNTQYGWLVSIGGLSRCHEALALSKHLSR